MSSRSKELFGSDSDSNDDMDITGQQRSSVLNSEDEDDIVGLVSNDQLDANATPLGNMDNNKTESLDSPKESPILSDNETRVDEVDGLVEKEEKQVPTQQDIFGEDIDVSSDDEEIKERENTSFDELGIEEDHVEKELPEEGVAIEIELPNVDETIGDEIFFVKLPNFLSIETKPFDPAFFEDEVDEDDVQDEEGRSRLKLKVENTIRWRHGKDSEENDIKESNARVVRWSDGSLSLHMGNEIFDIFKMPIEGMQNHLFVQQGTGLQAKSVFKEKLTFRPHSTKSQTHLKMTMSIADRVSKSQKIRLIPVTGKDPEATRQEMTKKEEERIRAQLRRESQQRRLREKSHSKGLTANYLESEIYEDDEQELEDSLAAIKNKYKKDVKAGRLRNFKDIYSDEDSDSIGKLAKAKEDLSSEDDSPRGGKRKFRDEELSKKKKNARKIIESDDESE